MSSQSYPTKDWEQYTKEEKQEFFHHMYHSQNQPLNEKERAKFDLLAQEMENNGSRIIFLSPPRRLSDIHPFFNSSK